MSQQTAVEVRAPAHPIDQRFVARWSPRAFATEPVPKKHIHMMLEAARWAPSSFNAQPWRFIVATDGPGRKRLDETILPGNRAWSDAAPVIIWVVAKTTMDDGKANRHAAFDTGAAAMQLVLQADAMGYRAHHMGGFDIAAAHEALGLDADHEVLSAIAIGKRGDTARLPGWAREREVPSDRKSQDEWVRHV